MLLFLTATQSHTFKTSQSLFTEPASSPKSISSGRTIRSLSSHLMYQPLLLLHSVCSSFFACCLDYVMPHKHSNASLIKSCAASPSAMPTLMTCSSPVHPRKRTSPTSAKSYSASVTTVSSSTRQSASSEHPN